MRARVRRNRFANTVTCGENFGEVIEIGIVGGGPGGLMTAWHLENKCPDLVDITILEASQRLGGKLLTRQFSEYGVFYEAGVAELYDYSPIGPDPLRSSRR